MKFILAVLKEVIKSALIFALFFVWISFLGDYNVLTNVLISLGVSVIITLLIKKFQTIHAKETNMKLYERTDAEKMFDSMCLSGNQTDFLYRLLSTRHNKIELRKNYIILTNQNNEKIVLSPYFKFENLTIDKLNDIIKKHKKMHKIIVICGDYDDKCNDYIAMCNKKILLLDKYDTYRYFYKEYDFFPEITYENKNNSKKTLKNLLSMSLDKQNVKGYIIVILILFFFSFYVRNALYYYIFMSFLIVLTLLILFKSSKKVNVKTDILK